MQASKAMSAPPPVMPAAVAPAPGADVHGMLAIQKQMFDMVQAMQAQTAPAAATAPPHSPSIPAVPVQDPMAAILAIQKQMFEMVQAMQATAAGHAPPAAPPPSPSAATETSTVLAMQKQMFDMMLTMMQAAQRTAAPPVSRPPGSGGPYRPPYASDGRDPAAYPRPKTPTEELRSAVSMVRDLQEAAREFGFGSPAGESAPADEDDESPVRVIDMGPAKGVINKNDGSLRVTETFMANLPDIIKFVGETSKTIREAREEERKRRDQQQQQPLPTGYVMAGPDYQPPQGYVAVPVDQIPPQAVPIQPLPEPPAEMPPPVATNDQRPKSGWGMPRPEQES
jgi:hypothetical protein